VVPVRVVLAGQVQFHPRVPVHPARKGLTEHFGPMLVWDHEHDTSHYRQSVRAAAPAVRQPCLDAQDGVSQLGTKVD
jgi:hypothetical protein